MLDPDLIERIRTIFLHDQPYVSIAEATALLGWSRNEMTVAIRRAKSSRSTRVRGKRSGARTSRRKRSSCGRSRRSKKRSDRKRRALFPKRSARASCGHACRGTNWPCCSTSPSANRRRSAAFSRASSTTWPPHARKSSRRQSRASVPRLRGLSRKKRSSLRSAKHLQHRIHPTRDRINATRGRIDAICARMNATGDRMHATGDRMNPIPPFSAFTGIGSGRNSNTFVKCIVRRCGLSAGRRVTGSGQVTISPALQDFESDENMDVSTLLRLFTLRLTPGVGLLIAGYAGTQAAWEGTFISRSTTPHVGTLVVAAALLALAAVPILSAWEMYRYRFLQPIAQTTVAVWLLMRTAEPIMRFTNG